MSHSKNSSTARLLAAVIIVVCCSTPPALSGLIITNAPGYTITWDGNDGDHFDAAAPPAGSIAPNNLALGGTAFSSSDGAPQGHNTFELNDGFYGNANSWIGGADPANAGVLLDGSYNVSSFAFGRDNGNNAEAGQFTDRCTGTYTIEFTADAGTNWFTVGTLTYDYTPGSDGLPGSVFDPYLRHEFQVELDGGGAIVANGIRITVPQGGVFSGGTAIDEIEVYETFVPDPPAAGVPGAVLWLKADSLDLAEGDPVSSWVDVTGNGNGVNRAGLAWGSAPVYRTNAAALFNGAPSVAFDSSALWTEGNAPVIEAREVFAVLTMDATGESIATLLSIGREGVPPFQEIRRGGLAEAYADDAGFDFGGGADGVIRVNGTAGVGVTFDVPHIFNANENTSAIYTNLYLGYNVVWGRPWKGHVAELIVYSNALTAAQRNAVGLYLSEKYGITNTAYRTPDAPPPITNGLTAWFNANDLVGLGDGDPVTEWTDSLGNGIVLDRNGLGGAAPVLQTNAPGFLNGKPSVSFNGNALWTDATDPVIDAQDIFVVATMASDAENIATLLTLGAEGFPPFQQIRRGGLVEGYADDAAFDFGGGGDGDIRINGAIGTAVTYGVPHIFNGTENSLGTYTNLFLGWNVIHGRYWKGQVAEILIFSNKLSASERNTIGLYLSDKYGISDVTYRTPDTPPPVTNNLSAWFSANDLYLADGDPVTEWEDRSGSGLVLNRDGLGGSAPVLHTNVPGLFNGNAAVSFNDNSLWTETADPAIDAQEIFAVVTMDSDSASIATLLSLGKEGAPPFQQVRRGGTAEAYADDAAFDFGGGADGVMRINGAPGSAITFGTPHIFSSAENNPGTYTNLYLGWNVVWGRPWKGYVAEIIIYNQALTDAERASVGLYLANKYGLTWDAPVVGPVSFSRTAGQPVHVPVSVLLTNSYNPGGGALTASWVSATSGNGHPVNLSGNWVFYTPPSNDNTTDTFSFRLANTNGVEAESVATVYVVQAITNMASIAGAVSTNGGLQFRWSGIPGRTNTVEGATELGPVPPADWTVLDSVVIGPLGFAEYYETNPPSPRYYRILEQLP